MRKYYITFISGLCILSAGLTAQNQFNMSQYMLYQAFVNPAAISVDNRFNAALFHRSQWVGVNGAPVTQGLSLNMPFKDAKNTVGLTLMHDKIGVNNATQVSAAYAYKLKLKEKMHLSFGLNAMMNIVQSNYAQINMGDDVFDQAYTANSSVIVMPNFRYGMYLTGSRYYAGFSIPSLLRNSIVDPNHGNTDFNSHNLHYYLQGGYLFNLNETGDLGTSTLIKAAAGSPVQIDLNVTYIYDKKLGVGLSYRTSRELVCMANYQITQQWKLGYAYDLNLSKLARYTSGSHELMLIFNLFREKAPVSFFNPRF